MKPGKIQIPDAEFQDWSIWRRVLSRRRTSGQHTCQLFGRIPECYAMFMLWVDVRVCVCEHLKRCKTSNLAGGMRPSCKRMPTKLCMMVEAGADHPGVPALPFQCFQQWDVASPRTTMPFPNKLFSFLVCTVFAIWISANFVRWNSCI